MALYRPTDITPSSFSGLGNGTVDVKKDMEVTWQVDGSSAMTAYQIIIQQNTTASSKVYDSGKIMLDEPFFGTDCNGAKQRYTAVIKAAELSRLSNGYANGYKLKIKAWWSASEYVEQLQPAYFNTRSEPELRLKEIPVPMEARKHTFEAEYTQKEGDTLNWFRWMIAESGQESTPLKDTGNIYGTEDVRCTYDGFFTGNTYTVRCICETENGIQADTGWTAFSVLYSLSDLEGVIQVCRTPIHDCLLVSWAAIRYITGTASGDYAIADGQLTLPEGSTVTWDKENGMPMRFDPPWSIAWKGILTATNCTLLRLSGQGTMLEVNAADNGFCIRVNGEAVFHLDYALQEKDIWLIALTPNAVYLRLDRMCYGLYPALALYPAPTLYPDPGVLTAFCFDGPIEMEQFSITGVQLLGPQVCEYLWVEKGTFAPEVIERMMGELSFEPEFGDNTWMLADFKHQLDAGNLRSASEPIKGVGLYRQESGKAKLTHLLDLPLTTTRFLDYGFKNQTAYQYYLFPQGENTFISAPLYSAEVRPVFWNWTLLVCREDENGIFHVEEQFVFRNNVESGTVTNNSAPGVLKNFTRYPMIQRDSANYRSGTLTALIGKVDQENSRYVDTTELADSIYALSTDTRPKFLKDRKGNLMRVELSSAIMMTAGDVLAPQPYTAQIPWAETDSAENISIIQTPEDGIPEFDI